MDHLEPGVVNSQIFPPLTSGFNDTESIIREHTVKVRERRKGVRVYGECVGRVFVLYCYLISPPLSPPPPLSLRQCC